MDTILTYGVAKGFNYLHKKNKTKQVLDPLTTVLRLGILMYKPNGTKISIHKNAIIMQNPNIIQGAMRWTCGDDRNDLHNLYEPIYAVTRWYTTKNNDTIARIFKAAIDGLKRIRNIYSKTDESNLVSHSICHYINILEIALHTPDEIDSIDIPAPWNIIWKKDEIQIVDTLFQIAIRYPNTTHYIKAIEHVLDAKDECTRLSISRTKLI